MNRLLLIVIAIAAIVHATLAHGGDCHHFFAAPVVKHAVVAAPVVAHHAAVVAPVIAAPVLYQAGYAIEQEAIAEKAALRALARFQAVQAPPQVPTRMKIIDDHSSGHYDFRTGKFTPADSYSGPAPLPPPPVDRGNVVAEKCGKCHSGASPKGGVTIDGVTPMPCESVLESLRQIKDDKMPRGGQLTPEEKGLLMEALLGLESK